MDELWRFLVSDAVPLIAVVVAIVAAVLVFRCLGLQSDAIDGMLDRQREGFPLSSMLADLQSIPAKAPESGLAELVTIGESNRDNVLKVLGTAEVKFRDRMHPLEVGASASAYVTGILLFITLIYAATALRSLMLGLSLEVQHSTTAILDVIQSILVVVFRSIWIVLCLFVLNMVAKVRVGRRKERWAAFMSRLTKEVLERNAD